MIGPKALQDFLIREYRSKPINRNQTDHITAVEWNLIRKAYAHLCKRANTSPITDTIGHQPIPHPAELIPTYGNPEPPIIHPAGAIPRDVEHAITQQIQLKRAANDAIQQALNSDSQDQVIRADPTPRPSSWFARAWRWFR